jgi:hypothetical protein
MLFSYITINKVAIGYTPYQSVYGLHPLLPIEYIVLVAGGNEIDNTLVKVLTSRIIEFEKLQEARMQVAKTIRIQLWNRTLWNQQNNLEK